MIVQVHDMQVELMIENEYPFYVEIKKIEVDFKASASHYEGSMVVKKGG